MAIWPNYTTFRNRFSVTGTIDPITGYEEWPVAKINFGGFTSFTVPRPMPDAGFRVTCNATDPTDETSGVDDSVPGTDEYNWWVSLRSDDPAAQAITVSAVANKSGTIEFGINQALARTLLNDPDFLVTTPIKTELVLHTLYRNVWIYVQRVSDDAIQVVDLLRASLADY